VLFSSRSIGIDRGEAARLFVFSTKRKRMGMRFLIDLRARTRTQDKTQIPSISILDLRSTYHSTIELQFSIYIFCGSTLPLDSSSSHLNPLAFNSPDLLTYTNYSMTVPQRTRMSMASVEGSLITFRSFHASPPSRLPAYHAFFDDS
jgi:hypothetical protein